MKKTQRLLLGFISAFLLAAGLARAAEYIDPLLTNLKHGQDEICPRSIEPCGSQFCDYIDRD